MHASGKVAAASVALVIIASLLAFARHQHARFAYGAEGNTRAHTGAVVTSVSAFPQTPDNLPNAQSDGRAIARAFVRRGHQLTQAWEPSIAEFLVLLADVRKLRENSAGPVVFYVTTHGVQARETVYLLFRLAPRPGARLPHVEQTTTRALGSTDPAGELATSSVAHFDALDVRAMLRILADSPAPSRQAPLVIVLDVCRTALDESPGLTPTMIEASSLPMPDNTLLVFTTSPGGVAYDNDRAHDRFNGVFVSSLLAQLPEDTVGELEPLFRRALIEVERGSLGYQQGEMYSTLHGV